MTLAINMLYESSKVGFANTLTDLISSTCSKYGEQPAFSSNNETITFKDVDTYSKLLATWLQTNTNLQKGDRVAIQLPNCLAYPIAAYAILRAGFVIVNTNPMYTETEMRHQYKDSSAKAIVIIDTNLSKLENVINHTDIETVISAPVDHLIANVKQQPDNDTVIEGRKVSQLQEIISLSESPKIEDTELNPESIALLQYTGGTTGVSKGATISHANILSNIVQTSMVLGNLESGKEIFVCPLPLYHAYAFSINLLLFFSIGGHNILITNPQDPNQFVKAMQDIKPTGFAGINTLFVGLSQVSAFQALDFSNLKFTLSGGSTLTQYAADAWKACTNCTVTEGYGLTETSPVLCLNVPGEEKIGSVGRAIPGTEVEIWNDTQRAVGPMVEGEIVARGPQVMRGYWNRDDETTKVLTADGWFKTGDIGYKDETGFIHIVDRLKDMIIVSGFNVYPNEIENVLTQHMSIEEAAVIGKDDDKTGERVCAYVTTGKKGPVSEKEVLDFCKDHLTGYKVPKEIYIIAALPKSTVGKILRRELRDQ